MIKLVVLDVDGTSIDRDNHFYDDDIKEIDFYKKKGIEFMFASGRDMLGVTRDTGNYEIDEKFDERDLIFYKSVENEGFITSTPGCFCVFFPTDVHRPACADGEPMTVRKVVVKVSTELLK